MVNAYSITGMTCDSCLDKVRRSLITIEEIEEVSLQLKYPQAKIISKHPLNLNYINKTLEKAGNYAISEKQIEKALMPFPKIGKEEMIPVKSIHTYKPLILIITFIAGVGLLNQYPFDSFSGMLWMRHFMAGFFIVFAFFKILNISGFVNAYCMYDVIAKKWKTWGYIYPFIELTIGALYLIDIAPFAVNVATIVVLGISSIGVIKSNLNKRHIQCACLGDVFNLPMSTVTIVEDLSMVGMAALMLFSNG